MLSRIVVAAYLLCAAVAAADELGAPPDPVRVQLLDEVPNYGRILADQWSSTVPGARVDSIAHWGLLSETGTPRSITLEESIALALANNTGLRINKLSPISAAAVVRSAYAQFDPETFTNAQKFRSSQPVSTISQFISENDLDQFDQAIDWNVGLRKRSITGASVAAEWSNSRISSDPNVINQLVPSYVTGLDLTLNQPLLRDFGWRFALLIVDVAQIGEAEAYYNYKAQVAFLVQDVELRYWNYVLAIEAVRVEEKGLELARELLRQNQGRFNVGALPRTAVLESEAEVARREASLVRFQAGQRIARDNLRALINAREEDTDALLMIEPADQPTAMAVDFALEPSLKIAYTQRPELVAARLNVDGRLVDRKIAQNALLPRLDFVGRIGLNGLGGDDANVPPSQFGIVNPQVLGGYDRSLELLTDGRYYQYLFGARVSIPIANAAAKANYAQANINSEAARLSLAELEELVTRDIKVTVDNLQSFLVLIESTRIARELAEENVRNQQARYDVGLATTKDLIDFQDRLTQAQREQVAALANYNSEIARWRFSSGTLLETRNVHLDRAAPEKRPWWAMF